jgi:hypothetical protein
MEVYCMGFEVFKVGDKVCVISNSIFKGLKGTICKIHLIAYTEDDEKPFLFYQINLEHTYTGEPIWFQGEEVDVLYLK